MSIPAEIHWEKRIRASAKFLKERMKDKTLTKKEKNYVEQAFLRAKTSLNLIKKGKILDAIDFWNGKVVFEEGKSQ